VALLTTDGQLYDVTEQRPTNQTYAMGAWVITWNESSRYLAQTIKHAATLRVLHALPDYLNFVTFERVDQRKLAAEYDLNQASISRALAELHALGVIEKHGAGPATLWRFSLNYGWKGNLASFNAEKAKRAPGTVRPLGPPPPPVVAEGIGRNPPPPPAPPANERQTRLRLIGEARGHGRKTAPENRENA
jgi:hypothetical protein